MAEGRWRVEQEEKWGGESVIDEAGHAHQGRKVRSLISHGKMFGPYAGRHAEVVSGKEIGRSDHVIWGRSACRSRRTG